VDQASRFTENPQCLEIVDISSNELERAITSKEKKKKTLRQICLQQLFVRISLI